MTHENTSRRGNVAALESAPIFVLIAPQMGENIGAAARAMLNFGVSGLRLVRPRDGWPNPAAAAMAAGASHVIDHATVFDETAQALSDQHFVLATTARRRELALPVMDPAEAASEMRARINAGQRCAVLFGGERNGLSSDDVAFADAIITVPVNPAFASINLAQAALVMAYEWGRAGATRADRDCRFEEQAAERRDVERLTEHLVNELDAAGFFFPAEKRDGMIRNLRAAFSRAGFTEAEVRTLRGAIKALVKRK